MASTETRPKTLRPEQEQELDELINAFNDEVGLLKAL